MEKVAIDLTWVRHRKVGGTESNVRNLLNGLSKVEDNKYTFVLLVTEDNEESFSEYSKYPIFTLLNTGIKSASQRDRVIWQNFHMGNLLRKQNINILLEPVYGLPFIGLHGIRTYTIIHDLQALHFPEYFSKGRVAWMKLSWRNAVNNSYKVLAISNFVKQDIINHYRCDVNKIEVLYDSIDINCEDCAPESELDKYGIKPREFYYTVSSLFPHKNLKTLLYAMKKLKGSDGFRKLVISGIGAGERRHEIEDVIKEEQLEDDIIFTKFVDNPERNLLYKSCKAFLFPSIFEGFGMPPLEAMAFGVPVLTTKETSILEVTGGLCNYVDSPLDPDEWKKKINAVLLPALHDDVSVLLQKYSTVSIAYNLINIIKQ